jgi:hypothetical protein
MLRGHSFESSSLASPPDCPKHALRASVTGTARRIFCPEGNPRDVPPVLRDIHKDQAHTVFISTSRHDPENFLKLQFAAHQVAREETSPTILVRDAPRSRNDVHELVGAHAVTATANRVQACSTWQSCRAPLSEHRAHHPCRRDHLAEPAAQRGREPRERQ